MLQKKKIPGEENIDLFNRHPDNFKVCFFFSRDIENSLMVAKGEENGRGLDWEFGISRCKLVYTEWINNKVLLYSTGNYIQYPVINHNGKEYEKEYMYN